MPAAPARALRERDQPLQGGRRAAVVDRVARGVHALLQGLAQPGDVQRGAGVQDHGVSPRPGLAVEHGADDRGVGGGVAAAQVVRRSRPGAELARVDRGHADLPAPHLGHQVLAGRRQLVQAAGAVGDQRVLGAERGQHLRDRLHQLRRIHAHHLPLRAGRVRQRPQHVEHGAHAQLAPDRPGVAHGRVVGLREHEAESDLVDAVGHVGRRQVDAHAQRLQHVGRPAARRHRPVAVLGDIRAARGRDQRRRRRDVERVGAVAAGAGRVDQRLVLRPRRRHVGAHRAGAAGDLAHRLALHAQPDQESGDLGGRGLAVHHLHHGRVRLLGQQVAALHQRRYGDVDHPAAPICRKFSISVRPCGVSTDSGWNWTPCTASSRCRTPITSPSGVRAVTTSRSGTSIAASEW